MATKRPLNKCNRCGYTWHPKGKDVSSRCPNCQGGDVSVKTPLSDYLLGCGCLLGLAAIGLLAFLAWLMGRAG